MNCPGPGDQKNGWRFAGLKKKSACPFVCVNTDLKIHVWQYPLEGGNIVFHPARFASPTLRAGRRTIKVPRDHFALKPPSENRVTPKVVNGNRGGNGWGAANLKLTRLKSTPRLPLVSSNAAAQACFGMARGAHTPKTFALQSRLENAGLGGDLKCVPIEVTWESGWSG
jgi:hypothetical protein